MDLEKFKTHLESIGYCDDYYKSVKVFNDWCTRKKIRLVDVTYDDITAYLAYHKTQLKSAGSYLNKILVGLKYYYRYLTNHQIIDGKILEDFKKIKSYKISHKKKYALDEKEMSRVIGYVVSVCKKIPPAKIKAVLWFLFYTGLRMGEFLRLKRADIDLDKMRILVKIPTKNSTERYGYFTPEVRDILIEYFNLEPETHNAFNTTEHQLKYFVERMNQYLPPNKHISIHSLRHSYAIMLAERNVNVAIAQKLLGHRNITTTMVYYAPKDRVVERIYRDSVNFINPDEESYDIH